MHTGARTLQDLFHDPHYAHAAKRGSATLGAVLLAGTIWLALAQGGTRLDTPMGKALAGSGVAAQATAVGHCPPCLSATSRRAGKTSCPDSARA